MRLHRGGAWMAQPACTDAFLFQTHTLCHEAALASGRALGGLRRLSLRHLTFSSLSFTLPHVTNLSIVACSTLLGNFYLNAPQVPVLKAYTFVNWREGTALRPSAALLNALPRLVLSLPYKKSAINLRDHERALHICEFFELSIYPFNAFGLLIKRYQNLRFMGSYHMYHVLSPCALYNMCMTLGKMDDSELVLRILILPTALATLDFWKSDEIEPECGEIFVQFVHVGGNDDVAKGMFYRQIRRGLEGVVGEQGEDVQEVQEQDWIDGEDAGWVDGEEEARVDEEEESENEAEAEEEAYKEEEDQDGNAAENDGENEGDSEVASPALRDAQHITR
ncbi:hypothetical protein JCM11641_007333 [Rhodosporidiobolus odoratus]